MKIRTKFFTAILLMSMSIGLSRCNTQKETIKPSTGVELTQVSYQSYVKPIISNYCITCHAGKNPSAGLDLQTYANVKSAAENKGLLKRINNHSDPMPVGGLMPREERLTILRWAKNNYKEFTEGGDSTTTTTDSYQFDPPVIKAIDLDEKGFELLKQMQGHWVGKMNLMGQKMPWFALDYRAIGTSQVHGIFEGGSMGNLFTSFFVANYKGTQTIMARNGGILNGIYRTSYFVLTEANESSDRSHYKLVDAYGSDQIMWMELTFTGDKIKFSSYTSRMGTYPKPKLHMQFDATKMHMELAEAAAERTNFPSRDEVIDFSNGLPVPDWGNEYPIVTSASYLMQTEEEQDYETLAKLAQDPYVMNQLPSIASLNLKLPRNDKSKGQKVSVYLSRKPLTDKEGKLILEYGYIKESVMNEVLLFPEISEIEEEFKLTYLHPGEYYITAVIDVDGNMVPSKGDISNKSTRVSIAPLSNEEFVLGPIEIQN